MTATSYGTWLPGDRRGYADNGQWMSPRPLLEAHVKGTQDIQTVIFSGQDQDRILAALVAAADEFGYRISDIVIEATHLHWIVDHEDSVATMVGRLKNRVRQRLARGRIWTAGYSHRLLFDDEAVTAAREYMMKHAGARLVHGQPRGRPT
ncbi:MAG TPA: hypothetical protein PJ982_00590 [Lacipirellulaceae bacterium]|nr:hypothetical protein [Lacipirellulaceae bacterium]